MDLLILDSWLREYLDTKATPKQIAEYLSLCGPSIERIKEVGSDFIYQIEVTTNRVDTASVYGIAREAAAILPRFKIPAKLKKIETVSKKHRFVKSVDYIKANVDKNLCTRFTTSLIKNVTVGESPEYVVKRLESAGVRSINNVVDISNYIMLALGQPVHTFDYDKILNAKMVLRESKRGEKITTLDGKEFKLAGGDIVIEDGKGRLIDLAGVMGGNLSMVDENTKNVLLFVQTYNPERIRRTSMGLAQRTNAATIFEKGLDSELVTPAMLTAIDLFETICKGKTEKDILDINSSQYKLKTVSVSEEFILKRLGIEINNKDLVSYLNSLQIESEWKRDVLFAKIPSFRAKDLLDAEDLVEEIARIYGYHNLPSVIMDGLIPDAPPDPKFIFEDNLRNMLSGWGGSEVYTLSLVSKEMAGPDGLRLKNSLGAETEYLRTSLMPSLNFATNLNKKNVEIFHIFEISNVYIPKKGDLPKEVQMLAGTFWGYKYADAKGIIEAMLQKLNINYEFTSIDLSGFEASKSLSVSVGKESLGKFGYPEHEGSIYYEFEIDKLLKFAKQIGSYKPIPKYPAQIEDITWIFPENTHRGEVLEVIKNSDSVSASELKDIFNDAFTFRIYYQDPDKTLTDENVVSLREKVVSSIKTKFGGTIKD